MDLTKTTSDIEKIDQFINQSEKQNIVLFDTFDSQKNHKSIKEQCGNYDLSNELKIFSNYHEVESSDDKQNTILVNLKHLKITQTHNSESRNDNLTVQKMDMSPNISVNQVFNIEKISNSAGEVNKSSDFFAVESNNEDIMKSSASTTYPDKNIESLVGFQEEKKIVEFLDEIETTKTIAETIATNSNNSDENNPKRKKKLQILLSRNQFLQNWDSCDINNECVKPNTPSPYINADTVHTNKKYISDKKIKSRKYFTEPQKKFDGLQTGASKIQNIKISEDHFLEKRRFEEIEDKLEEMFAGIEDEQLGHTTDKKHIPTYCGSSLHKFVNDNCNETNLGFNNELYIDNSLKWDTSTTKNSSLPITATKKPSLCGPGNKKQINLLLRDHKNPPKSKLYLKTMSPRRRFSIGISKELLKFSVKTCGEKNEKKSINYNIMGEEPMSPISLNFKTHREVTKIKKNVPKNKIKNNIRRRRSKYKKEITNICKSELPIINTKQSRQKIKQTRIQCVSSENDTEEKQLQTRDIDTKNRSPFVLVRNNGSIAIVNTVTPDDSNERFTRKPSGYVYERKTVKGCHSSTLSTKYDADTADSSWKCVFCKIGPHKKQLGDLFGPYIISSNCEEYRTTKDYLENFLKLKFVNEAPNSNIQNISKRNYEELININALGMSQVSANCYEIWVHEECAIWAPNTFVVGSRLAGLEEATWSCMRYECAYCLKQGAFLCCLQRDCKTTCHVPCALESKWLLDESKFWVYCSKHALDKFLNKN